MVCGACAVDYMMDQPEWLAWVEEQGYDTVDAYLNYDKYLRIFKEKAPDHLPRIVSITEYPVKPTMCERCLTFFPYDRRYEHLDHEEYGKFQLSQAWEARHKEAMDDPLAVEQIHRDLLVSSTHLLNAYVETSQTYAGDVQAVMLGAEMLSSIERICTTGIGMLDYNTGRLDVPTLKKHYLDILGDAGLR